MMIAGPYTSGKEMVDAQSITKWKGMDMQSLMTTRADRSAVVARNRSVWARINTALALYRSRARLGALDARLLDDIGLDRRTAELEANRPIWDAPASWTK